MTRLVVGAAEEVLTFGGEGPVRDAGADAYTIEGASVVCEGEHIVSVDGGPPPEGEDGTVFIDASGCSVSAGFVDCHTHLPFFGWRADEDRARLSGVDYESLHRGQGGIFRSAALLSQASDTEILSFSKARAREMLSFGTTSFETKCGYGLGVDEDLRQLRLAKALAESIPQDAVSTCLAAHAVPPGYSAGEWIAESVARLVPAAAREGLAAACDIYVESIAFSREHAVTLSGAAGRHGLRMRAHVDQLSDMGGAELAAQGGFASADHLNHTSQAGVEALAASGTAAVLLPGATFTLRQEQKPPARALLDAGAIVALGTDCNPGTSPLVSMQTAMALACRLYGLTPLEAFAAATVNSARVLAMEDTGRVRPGGRADLVLLDVPRAQEAVYRPDVNHVVAVVKSGRLVYTAPGHDDRIRQP